MMVITVIWFLDYGVIFSLQNRTLSTDKSLMFNTYNGLKDGIGD